MRVICITGKARHGKDTYAEFLKEEFEKRGKRVLVAHYAGLVKYICHEFCGWNGEKDEKGRTLLQTVGTDIFRKKKPDYWVDFILDVLEAFPDKWDFVLIPDTRFPNEYLGPMKRGFNTTLIRVNRPNAPSILSDTQKNHVSETAMDGVTADIEVDNSKGLDHLKEAAKKLAEEFCKA